MRVIHCANNIYVWKTGGTELFVRDLAKAQQQNGLEPLLTCHQSINSREAGDYKHYGLNASVLPQIKAVDRVAYMSRRASTAPGFADLLSEFSPNVAHFHSLSTYCGLTHIALAKSAGCRTVMTVHAPGFTCPQGSLLYHRREVCDGIIEDTRCTECRLVNGGLPYPIALPIASYSWPWLSPHGSSRLGNVLTAKQLTAYYRMAWTEVVDQIDAFHVLCDWSRTVLLRNGVPEKKLYLVRTAGPPMLPPKCRKPMEDGILRCIYWGRCAEMKGIHVIIDAVKLLPESSPISIDFYGSDWDTQYGRAMQKKIGKDPRFSINGCLEKDELLPLLQQYDLGLIPSTCLETGPLTAMESFSAGLAVAGSNLGGIRELLKGKDGCFLLPPEPSHWRALLVELIQAPQLLAQKEIVTRSFADISDELLHVYENSLL